MNRHLNILINTKQTLVKHDIAYFIKTHKARLDRLIVVSDLQHMTYCTFYL